MTERYAGDISAWQAWDMLTDYPEAVLVDVRTDPEWRFVGKPDLQQLGKETIFVSWQLYPDLRPNDDFVAALQACNLPPEAPVLLLCRSGSRSRFAAIALTEHGFSRCYNIADGFEGPPDGNGQRGSVAGWKAAGLPWTQN